ncbi:heparan sulfate glucosamine 3-O-sulfotransferase 5 [Saimiri boliviensis]|uniref:Sulfotransferase n=1 Tax=Saimiri boliviensis boliviensis TaxID=39432 RepID=A0A2K6TDM4_SAIBB|nr:heparan sulfate glucosamine 3-O-sulfotransferase 5 [Saimiri boliviensis boliviensis]XP_039320884.1 heparan sulfate glucosamine 3-O-sulfotransferase 5 [Saimiri boliviensis boliviensis]
MLFKQQAWLRQKLLVLGSLAVGSLLYLVARVGSLDRLQPICPIEGRLSGARSQAEFPLRALQFKRGLLHEFRKSNASKDQVHLHDLVQQLPKAIIIGVRKGGTRALLEMLNLHPAVVKASQEIHFFDNDENYGKGIEWYRKKMPFSYPQQITIEKSPAYFITEEVPERIYKMNSSIKLLIIVREPTTRAISDYTQVLEGKERKNKTYYKFEKLAIDPNTCEVNTKYKAVRTSIYTKHLERWLKYFPIEQFHVVDGDRLITEPLPELQLVEKFLNLPPRISQYNLYFNATRGFYCLRFNIIFNKCLAGSKGRIHPEVDPSVITKLRKFFHPFNQKFYQITGRTLNWP